MSGVTIICLVLAVLLYLGIVFQIVMSSRPATGKLFWTLFILVPVLGLVAYLLLGIDYRTAAVREKLHGKSRTLFREQMTPELQDKLFSDKDEALLPPFVQPLARLLRRADSGNKVHGGNSLEIITLGLRKRELLLEDIRRARRYIFIEYFKFGNDKSGLEVRQLLMEKAAEGVQIYFLVNNMYTWRYPNSFFKEMQAAGIQILPYTHIRNGIRSWIMHVNQQNHRKIVVIDGEVAYTGGMNLNDNYFYKWRDTHLRVQGPVIASLQASFMDHWIGFGGRFSHPLPYYFQGSYQQWEAPFRDQLMQVVTDAPENAVPATQMGYEWILQNARHYVYLQTPYFAPPDSLLLSLKSAALRGVEVRLMLPKSVDAPFIGPMSRGLYQECLEAGIRIFQHDGAFIHAKTLVADDVVTIIGASNLDQRSFTINCEVNSFLYGSQTALACKEIFLKDSADSRELTLEEWCRSRKWYHEFHSRFLLMFKHQF